MTPPRELLGRRVRVIAWYDHAPLIAAYRKAARPEGTITHVNSLSGEAAVSVPIDGQVGTYTFKLGIINQIGVLAPSRPNDVRPFSPGVSIGQDRAVPGATPSLEETDVAA
jgi:hypothetical protein